MKVGIEYMISSSVLKEEKIKNKPCECCLTNMSLFLLTQKQGIATVLQHVCKECLFELEEMIIRDLHIDTYSILYKY